MPDGAILLILLLMPVILWFLLGGIHNVLNYFFDPFHPRQNAHSNYPTNASAPLSTWSSEEYHHRARLNDAIKAEIRRLQGAQPTVESEVAISEVKGAINNIVALRRKGRSMKAIEEHLDLTHSTVRFVLEEYGLAQRQSKRLA